MNLEKAELKNLKSYYPEEVIHFNKGVNLFVGPNAGGKSNLFEVVQAALSLHIFYHGVAEGSPYYQNKDHGVNRYKPNRLVKKTPDVTNLHQIFERHFSHTSEELQLRLTLSIEKADIEVIKSLIKRFSLIKSKIDKFFVESNFLVELLENVRKVKDLDLYLNRKVVFEINAPDRCILSRFSESAPNEQDFYALVEFLRSINLYYEASLVIPEIDVHPVFKYFGPNRFYGEGLLELDTDQVLGYSSLDTYYSSTSFDLNKDKAISFIQGIPRRLAFLTFRKRSEILDSFNEYLEKYLRMKCYIRKNNIEVFNKSYNILFQRLGGTPVKFSSGEKEFFNLIAGLVLSGLKNGIVLIDEPELHLHPQWQSTLLNLIYDLSNKSKIQFFIVTHSAKFITYESLQNTFRISMDLTTNNSKVISPNSSSEKGINTKDVIHFINSTNNEKAFFADKVLLVEGISDLLVYSSILKRLQRTSRNPIDIEVIDVRSKNSLESFRKFLELWGIENYIIGDFDFLIELKQTKCSLIKDPLLKKNLLKYQSEIDSLITFSKSRLKNILCESPGKDAEAIVSLLARKSKMSSEDFEKQLNQLVNYVVKERSVQIAKRPTISKGLNNVLDEIAKKEKLMILRTGNLESVYAHLGGKQSDKVENAIYLTKKVNLSNTPLYLRKWFQGVVKG